MKGVKKIHTKNKNKNAAVHSSHGAFCQRTEKGEKTDAELFFHKNQCLADRPEGGLRSNKPGLNPGELASAGKGAGGGRGAAPAVTSGNS